MILQFIDCNMFHQEPTVSTIIDIKINVSFSPNLKMSCIKFVKDIVIIMW